MSIELHTSVVHQNIFTDDGHTLWADVLKIPFRKNIEKYKRVSPDELEVILTAARLAIHNSIEDFYLERYTKLTPKGYTVVRPSMWVAQLGFSRQTDGVNSKVYTEKGYKNGGVHYAKDEQHETFWPHWEAVENAGFVPHVRGSTGGAWLMLRNNTEAN